MKKILRKIKKVIKIVKKGNYKVYIQKRKNVKTIVALSKLSKSEVEKKLKKAKKIGLSSTSFLTYEAWDLTDNDIKELVRELKYKKEKRKINNEWYINVIAEKSNCSIDEARERADIAMSKGYTLRKYVTCGLYELSIEQLKNADTYEKYLSKKEKPKQIKKEVQTVREESPQEKVRKEKNWTKAKYKLEFLKATNACGCSHAEFCHYKMYDMTPEKMKTFITLEIHLKLQIRHCDYTGGYKYLENKSLFNETFKKYVKRKWFTNENLSYADFEKNVKGLKQIIYKPLNGIGGKGISKFYVNDGNNKEVYEAIMEEPAIIEECIVQAKEIAEIWPNTLNTIRIMTIRQNGKTEILNALLRIGVGDNVDNFASGGVAVMVDIKTGKVFTDAVNKKGKVFKKHPNSGKVFKEVTIPNWDKVKKTVIEASKVVDKVVYVGWDVCIKENGEIELIEGNHNQDAMFCQYPLAVIEGKGIRHVVDKYVWFDEKSKTI